MENQPADDTTRMDTDHANPVTDLNDNREPTDEDLTTRIAYLSSENRRLRRRDSRRAQRNYYQWIAIVLILMGGGLSWLPLFVTGIDTILIAISGTGIFTGLLIYYLIPKQLVSISTAEGIYTSFAASQSALLTSLGLCNEQIYIPIDSASSARLFVPRNAEYTLPTAEVLESTVIHDDHGGGVSLYPTGATLIADTNIRLPDEGEPELLTMRLAEASVESLELAKSVTAVMNEERNQVTFHVTDSVYGSVDRFDHPILSFLATGLAIGLNVAVTAETTQTGNSSDYVITCTLLADQEEG